MYAGKGRGPGAGPIIIIFHFLRYCSEKSTVWNQRIKTKSFFPLSLQPDVIDLCYFKLWMAKFEIYIKGFGWFTLLGCKDKGIVWGIYCSLHGQPWYIWISESSQPFRSQFLLYLALWTGLAGETRLTRSHFMPHIGWIYFY